VTAPPSAPDFGVLIPARTEHLHWVRGLCASVRHFMGDTPICVILDGDRIPADLERVAGLEVVTRDEVEPKELRDASFRSPRAKNAALWASPYETFLLLDADTIVWGDMRRLADFDRFDFVLDRPGVEPLHSVMDVELAASCFPDFDARSHVGEYVNNGVYLGRRGTLDLERYLRALRLAHERPGMFYGSQGSFNYMLFSAADEGTIRLRQRELQVQTGRTDRADVVHRFGFDGSEPLVSGDPVVLHWVASAKPRVRAGPRDYFAPMTHFRLEHRRATTPDGSRSLRDWSRLRFEDMACADVRARNIRGRLARTRRRSHKRYLQVRARVRRRTPEWLMAALRGSD
jgi:hypothetical protein